MKGGGSSSSPSPVIVASNKLYSNTKPPFRPAQDDSKPPLQDPILRSDPIETEEPVLRLPPTRLPHLPNPKP
ncbi:unnamed protein product [Linum trigynum]|uniref:Uncharacterized protein n=1 Tax=Linum trigynum TaxID=586398 RepID=A0AAV2DPA6_9ROSI